MKKCVDCIHWNSTGKEDYQGDCTTSANCVNTKNHLLRFTPKNEVMPIPERLEKKDSTLTKKGSQAWIDIDSADSIRRRQQVVYPDIRELTDESKKKLGRKHATRTA